MTAQLPIRLDVDPAALPAVTFALQRTIADLEARAIVAADRDADLGPSSAAEYRGDIGRLAGLLGQLGHPATRPDPERAAVVWHDGTYAIDGGRPVRLAKTASLDRLLAVAVERRRDGRLTPGLLIDLLAETTGSSTVEVVDRLADARRAAPDADRTGDRTPPSAAVPSAVRPRNVAAMSAAPGRRRVIGPAGPAGRRPVLLRCSRDPRQSRHRLAPWCQRPHPDLTDPPADPAHDVPTERPGTGGGGGGWC